jgi:hypothetical protein
LLLLSFSFREKTGLVRKDILDWMIELRNRGKRDAQDAKVSAKNQRNYTKFGKLNINFIK